jgi:hypothetical protein
MFTVSNVLVSMYKDIECKKVTQSDVSSLRFGPMVERQRGTASTLVPTSNDFKFHATKLSQVTKSSF